MNELPGLDGIAAVEESQEELLVHIYCNREQEPT